MFAFARTAAHWVGSHTVAAVAGGVLVVGVVGGGIGYSLAGQRTAAAPTTTSINHVTAPAGKGKAPGGRGQKIIDSALTLITTTQTGSTVASLREQLVTGTSMNAIAGAEAAAVEAQVIADITKLADKAVKTGKISAAQESSGLTGLKTRVDALMAEPGTRLVKDVDKLLQTLLARSATAAPAAAAPSPSPSV